MTRQTGVYQSSRFGEEQVRAFVPHPLPPRDPPLSIEGTLGRELDRADRAISRLAIAADLVPSSEWFLYGFVRKEALITSQIEGTQATLQDVMAFEAGGVPSRPDDVREVCNYVAAQAYARRELAKPKGLPLATRLLCEAHRRLIRGTRGADKLPGEVRRSQNWIGGTRPGNARFVPPPPDRVPGLMSDLEKWIHASSDLPPLVRAGLAHVQFETIHPFLDGNGRIGRLLIALLLEQWGVLSSPVLYLSLAFKRRQSDYYERLSAVRTAGDWEGWLAFFLQCVAEAAEDGVSTAQKLFALIQSDARKVMQAKGTTVPSIRLAELLPSHPVVTLNRVAKLLKVSTPTAAVTLELLTRLKLLKEISGKRRDRVFVYGQYMDLLTRD
jgi:Fic family protein